MELITNVEIKEILNEIKTLSPMGAKEKKNLAFFQNEDRLELMEKLDHLEVMTRLYKSHSSDLDKIAQHLHSIKDLTGSIERAKAKDVLTVVELFEIKNYLLTLAKLEDITKDLELLPRQYIIKSIPELSQMLDPQNQGLKTFYIYDCYSDNLTSIRRDILRGQQKLNQIYTNKVDQIFKETSLVIKPPGQISINKKDTEKIKLIQGSSHFIYDSETYINVSYRVNLGQEYDVLSKEIQHLKHLEQTEEINIRGQLSRQIGKMSQPLIDTIHCIAQLDILMAKAVYSNQIKGIKPQITEDFKVVIKGGIHPIVQQGLRDRGLDFTPLDITLKPGVTLITGANMGGKTVVLRTTALLCAMAQYGLFVPAQDASIGLSNYIFLSSGDYQSTQSGLSTFGAEVYNLNKVLDMAHSHGLILIDELARGTNPQEGTALSKALIEHMKDKQAISLITTHFDGLGALDGVKHLQVRGLKSIDQQRLKSYISEGKVSLEIIQRHMDYSLEEIDKGHQSPRDALIIASLMGLKKEIIDSAREYMEG